MIARIEKRLIISNGNTIIMYCISYKKRWWSKKRYVTTINGEVFYFADRAKAESQLKHIVVLKNAI